MSRRHERIVIAGAGLAGLRAAERVRELGFTGELVIAGAERHRPYHRPALSKQFLAGDLGRRELTLAGYVDLDADWRLGKTVRRLDPQRRLVQIGRAKPLRYDGLVIATGVRARTLPGVPSDPRVRVLRTIEDAEALQRLLLADDRPCVIIGGGFTATELASTLAEQGRDVVLVSRSGSLLGALGPELGGAVARLHRGHGVRVWLETQVRHWIPGEWGIGLHLTGGRFVAAGSVVLAVGGEPETEWLAGSGADIADGVLCEPTCHVAGLPDVVAAGDIARWPVRRGQPPRRVEHWLNAVEMGRAAAGNLLSGRASAIPFEPLPRFWTEQYGQRFQAAGAVGPEYERVALEGDPLDGAGVLGYTGDEGLVGVVTRERPRAMVRWTAELSGRGAVGRHRLLEPLTA
ncbi:NAD(P)/FAD-dependent oxidoreductase [Amycolatopsis pithecellobii]|uniref:NAD(P)/FAD-dependent oxidoreductase n=1 Tax=Amycolatopsis pithecellobii TaxID=664692 RepID=A0A6N7Z6E4_9PSEU|nr:FAD-dependent oxidoreductase [Amycolatopsis pithecellobii]MTD55126.1 NAD(P)/FAD-dependent oxidoreductase [Amycolatopsis pithecellobii]